MNRSIRQAIRLLKRAQRPATSTIANLIEEALRLISPPKKPSPFSKGKGEARKLEKAAKREAQKEETRALRAACLERSGGWCEWCRMVAFAAYTPPHMHHMEGGPGRRLEKQCKENVVMLCGFCHRGYHAHPADPFYRNAALTHCRKHDYPVPSIFRRGVRGETPPSSAVPAPLPRRAS